MSARIFNIRNAEFQPSPIPIPDSVKERYEGAKLAQIGQRIGAQKLGFNITLLPPGRSAFPLHNHRVNEELFFILEGSGEVRIGKERYPVTAGDFISCPPGGPETAHQIVNTTVSDMKFLAVATKLTPEIAEYPDSGKFGVLADFGTDAKGNPQSFRFLGKTDQSMGYWDGE